MKHAASISIAWPQIGSRHSAKPQYLWIGMTKICWAILLLSLIGYLFINIELASRAALAAKKDRELAERKASFSADSVFERVSLPDSGSTTSLVREDHPRFMVQTPSAVARLPDQKVTR